LLSTCLYGSEAKDGATIPLFFAGKPGILFDMRHHPLMASKLVICKIFENAVVGKTKEYRKIA
jgi:hypothetical protein